MLEVEPSGACNNCVSACCRASVILPLSEEEAETLRAVGTSLKELLPAGEDAEWSKSRYFKKNAPDNRTFLKKKAKALKPGQGFYGLESDCGFLEETEDGRSVCSIHNDQDLRPAVCGEFDAGSFACKSIKAKIVTKMYQEDSLVPSLAGVALGEEVIRTFEAA